VIYGPASGSTLFAVQHIACGAPCPDTWTTPTVSGIGRLARLRHGHMPTTNSPNAVGRQPTRNGLTRRPAAESATRVAKRRSRVSGRFADTTQ
jgi:hypothetical protein